MGEPLGNELLETAAEGPTVTALLARWHRGDRAAADAVIVQVYDELHRIAVSYFRGERASHTLQATAVVNEALMRLLERRQIKWRNGAHFIGFAARTMRHILVDHARRRGSRKRGGDAVHVSLSRAATMPSDRQPDLLALDEALQRLAALDPKKVELIELRFFAGMTLDESAKYLQVSEATVTRQWRRAPRLALRGAWKPCPRALNAGR